MNEWDLAKKRREEPWLHENMTNKPNQFTKDTDPQRAVDTVHV